MWAILATFAAENQVSYRQVNHKKELAYGSKKQKSEIARKQLLVINHNQKPYKLCTTDFYFKD